jgi:hypothetical protein
MSALLSVEEPGRTGDLIPPVHPPELHRHSRGAIHRTGE